ncbi:MAG: hypothetical protein LBG80_03975 [Bacteroidales bacterium]|nr:hypothetical protein [Bacteroidales bacterium]
MEFNYTNAFLIIIVLQAFFCGSIFTDETSYLEASKAISEFKSANGFAPTVEYYFDWILNKNHTFTNSETAKLWFVFIKQQIPIIQTKDLLSLAVTKRDSIRDFKCRLIVNDEVCDKNNKKLEIWVYDYALKENCFLVDEYLKEKPENRTITSSNGSFQIFITAFSDRFYPSASIDTISSKSKAFLSVSPLCQAMLFDSVSFEVPHISFDFALCDKLIVFEKEININGHPRIILGNKNRFYYLDKDKDFSVVKKEVFYSITEDYEDGFHIVGRYLSEETIFENLQDFGNGIWLPNHIVNTSFDEKSNIVRKEVIDVENMSLNSGIQESFFTDIIPENAVVADGIRGLVYRQSDSPSINSLIKETANSKRVFIYRYISIISGLVLIFIVLVIKYRLYLKDKRERENKTVEETK